MNECIFKMRHVSAKVNYRYHLNKKGMWDDLDEIQCLILTLEGLDQNSIQTGS